MEPTKDRQPPRTHVLRSRQPWHIPSACLITPRSIRMPVLRTQIEGALDELISQEEGMRFQGLDVVLGKQRWPELIAHQRKKDFGLDAYAPASLTPENFGKGLAASITPVQRPRFSAPPAPRPSPRPQARAARSSTALA